MTLSEAYEEWRDAEAAWSVSLSLQSAFDQVEASGAADAAFETLSALAFQQGYDPAGSLGIVEFVMREIAK